jgi:hypothetical protein
MRRWLPHTASTAAAAQPPQRRSHCGRRQARNRAQRIACQARLLSDAQQVRRAKLKLTLELTLKVKFVLPRNGIEVGYFNMKILTSTQTSS